jgi:hypothetical protein
MIFSGLRQKDPFPLYLHGAWFMVVADLMVVAETESRDWK